MKIIKDYLNVSYIISKFEFHDEMKETLLSSIESMNINTIEDDGQCIKKTDWNLDYSVDRMYWKILQPKLTEHMIDVYKELGFTNFGYTNYWFQQYYYDDFHSWHVHSKASYTNIYYLELPGNDVRTNLKDQKNNTFLIPDVKEGYILTMPGIIWHCSPPNRTNKRKTSIVFNVDTPS